MHATVIAQSQGRSGADWLAATCASPLGNQVAVQPMPPALQIAPSELFGFGSRSGSANLPLNSSDLKLALPRCCSERDKNLILCMAQALHQLSGNCLEAGSHDKPPVIGTLDRGADFGQFIEQGPAALIQW